MATMPYQQSVLENTTSVITQPNQQIPRIVPATPQSTMNMKVIKGLGIAQIIIGGVTLLFGIAATSYFDKDYSITESGAGIWGGLWIIATGIIGVISAYRPQSGALNGTNMAFCIIATVLVFIDGILFATGLSLYSSCKLIMESNSYVYYVYSTYSYYSYYSYGNRYLVPRYGTYYYYTYQHNCNKHKDAGRSIYGLLLLLMVAEFVIAMIAAVYCCRNTNKCCTPTNASGIVIGQSQPVAVVTNTTGQVFTTHSYPQSSNAQYNVQPLKQPVPQNVTMVPQYNNRPPLIQQAPQNTSLVPQYHTNQPIMNQQAPQNMNVVPQNVNQQQMVHQPPQYNTQQTYCQPSMEEVTHMEDPSAFTNGGYSSRDNMTGNPPAYAPKP